MVAWVLPILEQTLILAVKEAVTVVVAVQVGTVPQPAVDPAADCPM
jgi:hypothetical protein